MGVKNQFVNIKRMTIGDTYIYFNSRVELKRIEVSKIDYFESDGNYTDIVMVNKLRASILMNLGEMEKASDHGVGSTDHFSALKIWMFENKFVSLHQN